MTVPDDDGDSVEVSRSVNVGTSSPSIDDLNGPSEGVEGEERRAQKAGRLGRVVRQQSGGGHGPPTRVAPFPIEGRPPVVLPNSGPAVGKPEQGILITLIFHEGEKLPIRDRPIAEGERVNEPPVMRCLIVESERPF